MRSILVLLAALVITGTAAAHSPRVIGIGQKQNREDAGVRVGDTLVVVLPASASSGFHWRVLKVNRRILRPDARGFVPALHPPLAQSSAGISVFVFKVRAVGTTTLRMAYMRGNAVARRYTVLIRSSLRGD